MPKTFYSLACDIEVTLSVRVFLGFFQHPPTLPEHPVNIPIMLLLFTQYCNWVCIQQSFSIIIAIIPISPPLVEINHIEPYQIFPGRHSTKPYLPIKRLAMRNYTLLSLIVMTAKYRGALIYTSLFILNGFCQMQS